MAMLDYRQPLRSLQKPAMNHDFNAGMSQKRIMSQSFGLPLMLALLVGGFIFSTILGMMIQIG
jgi:hypothetical protein